MTGAELDAQMAETFADAEPCYQDNMKLWRPILVTVKGIVVYRAAELQHSQEAAIKVARSVKKTL